MISVADCLDKAAQRLRSFSDTAELDVQVLLARIMDKPRSWLSAHPELPLDAITASEFEKALVRLERGEPLPYVLGEWEFFNLSFVVTPDVLIPRPETELLVEQAISWLRESHDRFTTRENIPADEPPAPPLSVLDVGTGSGCIAISLAVNVPEVQIVATDISAAALAVARLNAERNNVADRINFQQADLFPENAFPRSFLMIVANLPYIPTSNLHSLPIYGREPSIALDGGSNGLVIIQRLIHKAPEMLIPGGKLLLEIEANQGNAVLSLAYDAFEDAEIHLHQDLAGHDRLLEIKI